VGRQVCSLSTRCVHYGQEESAINNRPLFNFGKLLVTQKFAGAVVRKSSELNANFWEHQTTAKTCRPRVFLWGTHLELLTSAWIPARSTPACPLAFLRYRFQ
jgi:hypothetical protein